MKNLLRKAFDPEHFRTEGHKLVDMLADHLEAQYTGQPPQVLAYSQPEEFSLSWEQMVQRQDLGGLFAKVLENSIALHHPHYLGHQISPPVPAAALSSLLVDVVNNGMGVYEMGMAGTMMEREVVLRLAKALGMGPKAGGFLTSGGSLANLTALLAARRAWQGGDVWQKGAHAFPPLALMVSEQAHYCVDRAARILGMGEEGIIKLPVDDQFRVRPAAMAAAYQAAQAKGLSVIALIGSACTTATGSFDPLPEMADFAEAHGLWFHVDGAHGAATAFSHQYKSLVAGIERADSVTVDFHKMLLTPAVNTALVFREESASYATFAQEASYLWSEADSPEWHNLAKRTFECTKQMYSLKAFALFHLYGEALFEQFVDQVYGMARTLADLIAADPQWELLIRPQANIVCFRHLGDGQTDLNGLNGQIRQRMVEKGHFYLVQTMIRGKLYLRVTLMNPFTEEGHLRGFLEEVNRFAQQRQS
ncbi:MAG: pyridoxal-dependent decarboxylase [Bacteroidota bacterium]